uniref:Serine/threonine-protein kinase 1 n=1 Tax=Steinernema glaseri TaxID=37863 RepID=A0A1I7YX23_9BILA
MCPTIASTSSLLELVLQTTHRMIKKKIQDLTVCFTYNVTFLQHKSHSQKQFKRDFRICDEIGRGGFGIVYDAIRVEDSQPVAVKFVEHKHVREWTMTSKQLIPTEICHLELCREVPGVVRLIDWFASSKGFMIVMERPPNCMDLFDVVSKFGRLDEVTARGIFKQVVDTVFTMYSEHSLIHRDIKDENVIVDMDTGVCKLVDFGAAAFLTQACKKEFQGTRSYCPPEWFKKLVYLPLEATCWSLGVLLYIMVTGYLPFRNEIQICLGRLKFPTFVSKECEHLIRRCLCVAPEGRATLHEIRQHKFFAEPVDTYHGDFHAVLRRRSVKRTQRRRGESFVGQSDVEDEKTGGYRKVSSEPVSVANNVSSVVEIKPSKPSTVPTTEVSDYEDDVTLEPVSLQYVVPPLSLDVLDEQQRPDSRYENVASTVPIPEPGTEVSDEAHSRETSTTTDCYQTVSDRSTSYRTPKGGEVDDASSSLYYSVHDSLPDVASTSSTVDDEDGAYSSYSSTGGTLKRRNSSVIAEEEPTEEEDEEDDEDDDGVSMTTHIGYAKRQDTVRRKEVPWKEGTPNPLAVFDVTTTIETRMVPC